MLYRPDLTAKLVDLVVAVCGLGFLAIVVVGKRGASKTELQRDVRSHLGFLLQCIAYPICAGFHRPYFSPFLPMPRRAEGIVGAATIVLAIVSVWFCFRSAKMLGKQWALVARVIEGHQLITTGPYGMVRNPIYLAMLGMLVATGLALASWPALLGSLLVFMAGTKIRIESESRLLRTAFGAEFNDYARRVPALFPHVF
jgi:protein-S-isoprenylcysteine O-methyltransferase Ste14